MNIKDYYNILGVNTNPTEKQLDSNFKNKIDQIKRMRNTSSRLDMYSEIFEAYYILRQEEPKAVYEECQSKIKNKNPMNYTKYEISLENRFNTIVETAKEKAEGSYIYFEKNQTWNIILEMLIESVLGIIFSSSWNTLMGLIILVIAIVTLQTGDKSGNYIVGILLIFLSLYILIERFRHLKRKHLFE